MTTISSQKKARLIFDNSHLDAAIVRSKSELKASLARAPYDSLIMPAMERSLWRMVRAAIMPAREEPIRFPRLEEVAAQFAMTPQTMRRRLKAEQTSYRQIKENIRRDFAMQKLVRGGTPIHEISHIVGFNETRSFTRAFRNWTGMSPGAYRRMFHEF